MMSTGPEFALAGHVVLGLMPPQRLAGLDLADLGDPRAARVIAAARRHPGDLPAIESEVVRRRGCIDHLVDAVRVAVEVEPEAALLAVRLAVKARRAARALPDTRIELPWPRCRHAHLDVDGLAWLERERLLGRLDDEEHRRLVLATLRRLADAISSDSTSTSTSTPTPTSTSTPTPTRDADDRTAA